MQNAQIPYCTRQDLGSAATILYPQRRKLFFWEKWVVEVLCLTSVNLLNHCLGELGKSFMQTSYSIILASNLGSTEQTSCLIFLTLYGMISDENAGTEQYSNLTFATTHKHHGRNISALENRLLKYYSKSNSPLKQTQARNLKSWLLLQYKISCYLPTVH